MSHFIAKVEFYVDLPQADDKYQAELYLNELIDKLATVDTAPSYWDDVEWQIHEIETEDNE